MYNALVIIKTTINDFLLPLSSTGAINQAENREFPQIKLIVQKANVSYAMETYRELNFLYCTYIREFVLWRTIVQWLELIFKFETLRTRC